MNRPTNILIRLAWLTLLTSHAFWFVRSLSAASAFERRLALAATIVFLTLKVIDLPALRFSTNPRALLAGLLIVALMHTGVIERTVDITTDINPWTLPAILTAALVTQRRIRERLIRAVYALAATRIGTRFPTPCLYRMGQWSTHPPALEAAFVVKTPRAPPR